MANVEPLMANADTSGACITSGALIRRVRRLPHKGEVLVQAGQRVMAQDPVAEAKLPGGIRAINVAGQLGVDAAELPRTMLVQEGEPVSADTPLARAGRMFGLVKSECCSPIDGTIESISAVTGQVLVRGRPMPMRLSAYIDGTVSEVVQDESVTVETTGVLIQGVFGLAGEAVGEIAVVADSPSAALQAALIRTEHRGKVLVGGSRVTADALQAAVHHGATGIVCGSLDDKVMRAALGYELGVAITGGEDLGLTLVMTEGFGNVPMAAPTFDLLRTHDGARASINGATQIRAGAVRPEVIIPLGVPWMHSESSGARVLPARYRD